MRIDDFCVGGREDWDSLIESGWSRFDVGDSITRTRIVEIRVKQLKGIIKYREGVVIGCHTPSGLIGSTTRRERLVYNEIKRGKEKGEEEVGEKWGRKAEMPQSLVIWTADAVTARTKY